MKRTCIYCFTCSHVCNDSDTCRWDKHDTTEVDDVDIYLASR